MANWALTCKNCRAAVAHFRLPDMGANYYIPDRPEFPSEGLERECPNCHSKFTYQATELTFRQGFKSRPIGQ